LDAHAITLSDILCWQDDFIIFSRCTDTLVRGTILVAGLLAFHFQLENRTTTATTSIPGSEYQVLKAWANSSGSAVVLVLLQTWAGLLTCR